MADRKRRAHIVALVLACISAPAFAQDPREKRFVRIDAEVEPIRKLTCTDFNKVAGFAGAEMRVGRFVRVKGSRHLYYGCVFHARWNVPFYIGRYSLFPPTRGGRVITSDRIGTGMPGHFALNDRSALFAIEPVDWYWGDGGMRSAYLVRLQPLRERPRDLGHRFVYAPLSAELYGERFVSISQGPDPENFRYRVAICEVSFNTAAQSERVKARPYCQEKPQPKEYVLIPPRPAYRGAADSGSVTVMRYSHGNDVILSNGALLVSVRALKYVCNTKPSFTDPIVAPGRQYCGHFGFGPKKK